MSGHITCFGKSAGPAYFRHSSTQTTLRGKENVDFFETLILIIFELKLKSL